MAPRPEFDRVFGAPDSRPAGIGGDNPRVDEACSCDLVAGDAQAHVYNEEAFRYFLDIERRRAEMANRPFLLLLLDLKKQSLATVDIDETSAEQLFAALATCLRDTDFFGWYRAQSVVGAVLTQHADSVGLAAQETVLERVLEIVRTNLPPRLASRVQARVFRLPAAFQGAS